MESIHIRITLKQKGTNHNAKLYLIGMPASGKSTLGKMAAAALQYNFVDTDDTIMDTYHADLMHLIDQFGIDGFIELESKILQQVQVENTIIATGGSAIYSDAAMQHLKQTWKLSSI